MCGYICHKACRNSVRVSCVKNSSPIEKKYSGKESPVINIYFLSNPIFLSKISPDLYEDKINAKIKALQMEIDIEAKMMEGLNKIIKAKDLKKFPAKGCKKMNPTEVDIFAQVEKSEKKMELLSQELANCTAQAQSSKTMRENLLKEIRKTASVTSIDKLQEGSNEAV